MTYKFTASDVMAARYELARRHLADYCGLIEIPGAPVEEDDENDTRTIKPVLAAHHRLLIEKLEAVERGDIRRLMVFMPPGSAKSSYASVVFPTWFMGRAKRRNVIVATYASDLARKIGRRARSILRQPAYRNIFGVELSAETAAADEWALTNENEFMGGGILSGITGNRADCLRGDSVIQTEAGPKSIKELVSCAYSGKVLSYDEHSRKLVYRRVQAVARRSSPDFYRVHTASGLVVECTGDHRIYTSRGYVEARLLSPGDDLLRDMRSADGSSRSGHEEGSQAWGRGSVLQPSLSHRGYQHRQRSLRGQVQRVREHGSSRLSAMFVGMQAGGFGATQGRVCLGHSAKAMRGVRQELSSSVTDYGESLLLDGVQERGSFSRDDGRRQSCLAGRGEYQTRNQSTGNTRVLGVETRHQGSGRRVRRLPCEGEATGPSHRSGHREQRVFQSGYVVQDASRGLSRGGQIETACDPVALVERVCQPTDVFDIQVEGTHCFFANGILVHNCIIIDDPIKGRQQADSEVIRETTLAAYNDDLKTRLKPGGRIILIQTRWHSLDLAGSILPDDYAGESGPIVGKDGETWEVLSIPAQALDNDPLGRRPGEMLWPEWFDESHWRAFRSNPRTWSALYQQNPSPEEGSYFRREWFKRYRQKPNNLHVYMTSDHATKEDAGDYTVFRLWGVDPIGDLYMLGGFKSQETTDKWMVKGVQLIKDYKPLCWFPENDQAWRAVAPFVQRYMYSKNVHCRREPLPTSGGDKPTKARGFQAMASMGKVWLPDTPEGDEILNEYLRFPAGKHDDEVDAAANMGRALDEAHPAIVKTQKKPDGPRDSYTRARVESRDDNDWMVA